VRLPRAGAYGCFLWLTTAVRPVCSVEYCIRDDNRVAALELLELYVATGRLGGTPSERDPWRIVCIGEAVPANVVLFRQIPRHAVSADRRAVEREVSPPSRAFAHPMQHATLPTYDHDAAEKRARPPAPCLASHRRIGLLGRMWPATPRVAICGAQGTRGTRLKSA
jgi:hypothetical protein